MTRDALTGAQRALRGRKLRSVGVWWAVLHTELFHPSCFHSSFHPEQIVTSTYTMMMRRLHGYFILYVIIDSMQQHVLIIALIHSAGLVPSPHPPGILLFYIEL